MILGIRPTVDLAFKKLLGSPDHTSITVHFLNAVLACTPRISEVEILNPILEPDWDSDKLAVLDVLAVDESGRQFNIEMQTSLPAGLTQRLVYYASSLYVSQLGQGEVYTALRPAISICVLERALLADSDQLHSDFRLRRPDGRTLTDDLQVHLVELSKSRANEHNIRGVSALESWAYFLLNADRYTSEELRKILPEREFVEAIGVLEKMSRSPEERTAYDARLKSLRDDAARLEFARMEGERVGIERGWERGREEGLEQGLEQGLERGKELGALIGKVQLLEQLLNLPQSDERSLSKLAPAELTARMSELQRKLQSR